MEESKNLHGLVCFLNEVKGYKCMSLEQDKDTYYLYSYRRNESIFFSEFRRSAKDMRKLLLEFICNFGHAIADEEDFGKTNIAQAYVLAYNKALPLGDGWSVRIDSESLEKHYSVMKFENGQSVYNKNFSFNQADIVIQTIIEAIQVIGNSLYERKENEPQTGNSY